VVIIADRRLVTQSYGRRFLASLPAPARVFRDRDALVEAVREFLA
jgi:Rad3-related DNA helicase